MQQKAQFVSTVMHEPELLILDEPFTGFDPVNAEIIKNEILELNKKGATVIFSTHRMESVEELCTSIALLDNSHKILDGRVKDIKNSYRNNTYILEYEGGKIRLNGAAPFDTVEETTTGDDQRVKLQIKQGNKINDVLQYFIPQANISRVEEVIPTMTEIFIKTVSKTN
jgi:ABC-2 type transport system ATP-binding protein